MNASQYVCDGIRSASLKQSKTNKQRKATPPTPDQGQKSETEKKRCETEKKDLKLKKKRSDTEKKDLKLKKKDLKLKKKSS